MTTITIQSFNPFTITLPADQIFSGRIRIELPPVNVKLLALPTVNCSIVGNGRILGVDITLPDDGVDAAKMMGMVTAIKSELEQIFNIAQGELMKRPLLH